jgi:hypothetical protein
MEHLTQKNSFEEKITKRRKIATTKKTKKNKTMVPSFPQWQIRQLLTRNHAPRQILHKCMISFQILISCLEPLTFSYYGLARVESG